MKKQKSGKRLAVYIALEVALIVFLAFVLFWPFRIGGQSMQPRFNDGGTVIATRLMTWIGRIDRGHVIICRIYHYETPHRALKRVIGLPGEHILIYNGNVYINGELLPHSHLTPGSADVVLGFDEFFILGDDRVMSYDSRLSGIVNRSDIIARVLFGRSF